MKDSPDQLRKKLGQYEQDVSKYRGWADALTGVLVNNADVVNVTIVATSFTPDGDNTASITLVGDKVFQRQLVELIGRTLYAKKEEALTKKQEIERELL